MPSAYAGTVAALHVWTGAWVIAALFFCRQVSMGNPGLSCTVVLLNALSFLYADRVIRKVVGGANAPLRLFARPSMGSLLSTWRFLLIVMMDYMYR